MIWHVKDHTVDNQAPIGFGNPAAYALPASKPTSHHVVYQGYATGEGGDQKIHELYWAPGNGGWKLNELIGAASGAPAIYHVSSPSAYALKNTQHVLYHAGGDFDDYGVHELYGTADGVTVATSQQ